MTTDFARAYTAALIEHVRRPGEAGLERAHELGRHALTDGLGALSVVEQHELAVRLTAQRHGLALETVRDAALPFLLQSLAALDMAVRGFVEASERIAVERAHVSQLRRLADAFVGAHVDHLADQRLRALVESVQHVVSATGAYVQFGGLRLWHGVAPALAEAIGAQLLADGMDPGRGVFAGASPAGDHWLAARLDAASEWMPERHGIVVACRDAAYTAFDAAVLAQFAKLASASLRNALIYEHEHDIAATLQSNLLPEPPLSAGELTIAARYQPSGAASGIGGDWFDVVALPAQRVGLVMGDVMGHGLSAAALMVQLSVAVHAYAVDEPSPSALLRRVDHLLLSRSEERLATIIYAIVTADGSVRFANAGHPPPLVVTPAGTTYFLEQGLSVPIGVHARQVPHQEDVAALPPGSTLLLYTDGLVEQRGRPIDRGLDLLEHIAATQAKVSLDAVCDTLFNALVDQPPKDDVCLLAVRIPRSEVSGDVLQEGCVAIDDEDVDPAARAAVEGAR